MKQNSFYLKNLDQCERRVDKNVLEKEHGLLQSGNIRNVLMVKRKGRTVWEPQATGWLHLA